MSSNESTGTRSRLEGVVESFSQAAAAAMPVAVGTVAADGGAAGRDAVMRIPVSVQIVLGSVRMPVAKLLSLTRGSIIPLDRRVGDLVDIVVNDRTVARGEVVALEEADKFAISVLEVVRARED